MVRKTIPDLRCAAFLHWGSGDELGPPVQDLLNDWLPEHNGKIGGYPLVLEYVDFGTNGPRGDDAIFDVYMTLLDPA
jgi:predicted transcriptional regulator YdeE